MEKIKKLSLFVGIFYALVVSFSSPFTFAQESGTETSPGPGITSSTDINQDTVKGTVLKIENNDIVLQTDDGIKEFTVPANIKVTKNMFGTEISSVQPNDSVIITQTDNGEILAVDAVSGNLIDRIGALVPVIMIGIGLIILGLLLSRSKNVGFIKTKPTNLS